MLDLRRAVSLSLVAALGGKGLTKEVEERESEVLLSAWLVGIILLQDEDDDIRADIAHLVSSVLSDSITSHTVSITK
jgi:hypothetical protein